MFDAIYDLPFTFLDPVGNPAPAVVSNVDSRKAFLETACRKVVPMPADLFDPASRPEPMGARRRLTVATSVAIHAILVLLLVVMPLLGGVSMPAAMNRIHAFVAPAALPPPPAVQPPSPAHSSTPANPNAAPLHAPDSIAPEVSVPVPGVPQVPGALPVGPGYSVPRIPGGIGDVALSAPAPPQRREPVRAGGDVQFPQRVVYVAPVYPRIAQSARVEGTVTLEAVIDETGAVTNLRVLGSIPLLDAAAKDAVAKWRYSPTTLNGITVPIIMTVRVTFTLK
jgi:periplasmic protein TonB